MTARAGKRSRPVACAALALALALPAAAPAEPRTNLADVEDEVMCPICGTLLELSEAPQAERQRAFIRRLIAEGQTKDRIKDALVAEFGPEVLALPGGEGFDLAAWLVPGAGLAAAGIAVLAGLRRWRRAGRPGDGEPPAPLDGAEEERLREDLARFEP